MLTETGHFPLFLWECRNEGTITANLVGAVSSCAQAPGILPTVSFAQSMQASVLRKRISISIINKKIVLISCTSFKVPLDYILSKLLSFCLCCLFIPSITV